MASKDGDQLRNLPVCSDQGKVNVARSDQYCTVLYYIILYYTIYYILDALYYILYTIDYILYTILCQPASPTNEPSLFSGG